jgi:hypothetical protein
MWLYKNKCMHSDESRKRESLNHVVIMISSKSNRTPPFESRSYVWKEYR